MPLSKSASPARRCHRVFPPSRQGWARLAVAAAWSVGACAQTAPGPAPEAPPVLASPLLAVPDAPARAPTGQPRVAAALPAQVRDVADDDPLADLLGKDAGKVGEAPSGATVREAVADTPESAALAELDDSLAGPPEPPPPPLPNVVLFPHRLGEFRGDPVARPGGEASTVANDAPPVFASSLPSREPAEESVWGLAYSGRAAYEDSTHPLQPCPGGSSLSTGIGAGLACRGTGEVKVRESLWSLGGGSAVEVVAQARAPNAATVNGRPAAVDPYQLIPQFYTAVRDVAGMEGTTMWAGRRDSTPFLMSSGLLPPSSSALRFGVDDARVGSVGLSYQYTARNDTNGQHLPSYHSVRTSPITVNDKGTLQLGFTRVEAEALDPAAGNAWWASAMHEQKGVLAGTNRFGLQYGSGSRLAMTGYTGMGDTLSRVRVAESMEWKGRSGLAGSVESSLQYDRSAIGTLQWMTTRVRPAYIASERFKLNFEVAHDEISSGFGVSGQRTAFTIAPTLTLGKAAGNANLRAFYTYSRANDVDGISFAAPADAWQSQASGSIFGIQLNRRW